MSIAAVTFREHNWNLLLNIIPVDVYAFKLSIFPVFRNFISTKSRCCKSFFHVSSIVGHHSDHIRSYPELLDECVVHSGDVFSSVLSDEASTCYHACIQLVNGNE